ncbi:MAG: DUF4386 family protein [Treponemataceae bacterium]
MMDTDWRNFHRLSGYASFLLLALMIAYAVIIAFLGPQPTDALSYFNLARQSPIKALLVSDLNIPIALTAYFFIFLSLWKILNELNRPLVALASALTCMAVAFTILGNTDLALIRLAKEYFASNDARERQMIEAAGKALFANNMWHSSAAYFCGIFMQGSGVLISLIMLKSKKFSRITAYSGIWGNGFDLAQHLIHLAFPSAAGILLKIAGPGYLVWYIFLGLDLLRNSKQRETAS